MEIQVPFPALVIDSASESVVVGLETDGTPAGSHWSRQTDEAGVGIFARVADIFNETCLKVSDLRCIIFCEGPGSILGVRIGAMAIRTWQSMGLIKTPCFSYRSLELFASDLRDSGTSGRFTVISDARRSSWNVLEVDEEGQPGVIQRLSTDSLAGSVLPIYHPVGFPVWQTLPSRAMYAPYRPERIVRLNRIRPLLRACSEPNAFMVEIPEYRKAVSPVWSQSPTRS